jgi:hypothetical protein
MLIGLYGGGSTSWGYKDVISIPRHRCLDPRAYAKLEARQSRPDNPLREQEARLLEEAKKCGCFYPKSDAEFPNRGKTLTGISVNLKHIGKDFA